MSVMKRVLAVLAVFTMGCGAGVTDDGEGARVDDVVRGTRDRGRHPAVVALRASDGLLCTGALVAPRVVLTARHCVSYVRERVDCTESRQVFGDRDSRSFTVIADEDAIQGAVVARVERVVVPPTQRLCGADVALLVLDRALRGITPLNLADAAPREGDVVSVVGYGRRGDSARAGIGLRYARNGVRIVATGEREFATGEGTCGGDSGSPAIDARAGQIVGVLSRGGERCVGAGALAVWTRASAARALLASVR